MTGSRYHPLIRFTWDAPTSQYASDPPPGDTPLFVGGEPLVAVDASGARAFSGTVAAPVPMILTAPDPAAAFHLPSTGDLAIGWVASDAARVQLVLTASAADGSSSAFIRCFVDDTGQATIPRTLLDALPPPPRQTRLDAERANNTVAPTVEPGVGVLVHAAQATYVAGD